MRLPYGPAPMPPPFASWDPGHQASVTQPQKNPAHPLSKVARNTPRFISRTSTSTSNAAAHAGGAPNRHAPFNNVRVPRYLGRCQGPGQAGPELRGPYADADACWHASGFIMNLYAPACVANWPPRTPPPAGAQKHPQRPPPTAVIERTHTHGCALPYLLSSGLSVVDIRCLKLSRYEAEEDRAASRIYTTTRRRTRRTKETYKDKEENSRETAEPREYYHETKWNPVATQLRQPL
ncbi:hypothetical protein C8Q77DRAFT_125489 [Trametes polyzona]|nr:hypothetical protein C8Q77DRAFT_125489 [Trametes polyzona]